MNIIACKSFPIKNKFNSYLKISFYSYISSINLRKIEKDYNLPFNIYSFYDNHTTKYNNVNLLFGIGISSIIVLNTPMMYLNLSILLNAGVNFFLTYLSFKNKNSMSKEVKHAFLIYGKNQIMFILTDNSMRIFSFIDIINSKIVNNKLIIYLYDAIYSMDIDIKKSSFIPLIIDMLIINQNLNLKKIDCLPSYFKKKQTNNKKRKELLSIYLYRILNIKNKKYFKLLDFNLQCRRIFHKNLSKYSLISMENYIDQNFILDLKTELNTKKLHEKPINGLSKSKRSILFIKNKEKLSGVIYKSKRYLFQLSTIRNYYNKFILKRKIEEFEYYEKNYTTISQDELMKNTTSLEILNNQKRKYGLHLFENNEKFQMITNLTINEYINSISNFNDEESKNKLRSLIFTKTSGRKIVRGYLNNKYYK